MDSSAGSAFLALQYHRPIPRDPVYNAVQQRYRGLRSSPPRKRLTRCATGSLSYNTMDSRGDPSCRVYIDPLSEPKPSFRPGSFLYRTSLGTGARGGQPMRATGSCGVDSGAGFFARGPDSLTFTSSDLGCLEYMCLLYFCSGRLYRVPENFWSRAMEGRDRK